MDQSLLIAVFVPTTDGTGKDFEGKRGQLAIGYPVGKDLILTARDVLQPGSPDYRVHYRLKLCWHHFRSNDDSDWIEISEDKIVWRGQGDLDAALIRCRRPPEAVGWGIVSSEKPLDGMRWSSGGFARATRHEDVRNPDGFGGEIRSTSDQDACFELTEDLQPEKGQDWKGVSGMPVFVGRKILGVVRSVTPNVDTKTLYATPTWRLLEDEAFRRAIGYDEQLERVESVKVELAKTLTRSTDAIDTLVEKLRMDNEMAGLDHTQRAKQLADRLLPATDIRLVIDTLRDTHRSLCEDDETAEQRAKAAEIVTKAAQLIVPAVYDYGVVQWTRSQKGSDGIALVPLPAGIKTVAEIIMAGVDGRKTKLRQRKTELDYPEGELSLPQLPECGIDLGGAKAREALQKHLEGKFTPEKVEGLRHAVDDYLIATKYPPDPGKERVISWEQRIKPTADQIARESRDSKQTFYLVLPLPDDVEGENAMRSLAKSLKNDYSAIMFLSLDHDYQQGKQDRDLVYPFCCMLPLQRGDPADFSPTALPITLNPLAPTLPSPALQTGVTSRSLIMRGPFDVFLSHNSKDKLTVRQLAQALQARGLQFWLDEEQLVPGRPWQEALEQIIQTARTAAVLVGKDGLGPWEIPEMRACLSEFVNRHLPVIPVLLPDAPVKPELPLFLRAFTWVDLRGGLTEDNLNRLEWGITGVKPGQSLGSAEDRLHPLQTLKEKLSQWVKRIWR